MLEWERGAGRRLPGLRRAEPQDASSARRRWRRSTPDARTRAARRRSRPAASEALAAHRGGREGDRALDRQAATGSCCTTRSPRSSSDTTQRRRRAQIVNRQEFCAQQRRDPDRQGLRPGLQLQLDRGRVGRRHGSRDAVSGHNAEATFSLGAFGLTSAGTTLGPARQARGRRRAHRGQIEVHRRGDTNCDGTCAPRSWATPTSPARAPTATWPGPTSTATAQNLCHRSPDTWAAQLRRARSAPAASSTPSSARRAGRRLDRVPGLQRLDDPELRRQAAQRRHDAAAQQARRRGVEEDRRRLHVDRRQRRRLRRRDHDLHRCSTARATRMSLLPDPGLIERRRCTWWRSHMLDNAAAGRRRGRQRGRRAVKRAAPQAEIYQINYMDPFRPQPPTCGALSPRSRPGGLLLDQRGPAAAAAGRPRPRARSTWRRLRRAVAHAARDASGCRAQFLPQLNGAAAGPRTGRSAATHLLDSVGVLRRAPDLLRRPVRERLHARRRPARHPRQRVLPPERGRPRRAHRRWRRRSGARRSAATRTAPPAPAPKRVAAAAATAAYGARSRPRCAGRSGTWCCPPAAGTVEVDERPAEHRPARDAGARSTTVVGTGPHERRGRRRDPDPHRRLDRARHAPADGLDRGGERVGRHGRRWSRPRRPATTGADADGDGLADACDADPADGPQADADRDGVLNERDNCPLRRQPGADRRRRRLRGRRLRSRPGRRPRRDELPRRRPARRGGADRSARRHGRADGARRAVVEWDAPAARRRSPATACVGRHGPRASRPRPARARSWSTGSSRAARCGSASRRRAAAVASASRSRLPAEPGATATADAGPGYAARGHAHTRATRRDRDPGAQGHDLVPRAPPSA